ncbi:CpaF family protein [Candidatus Woesearchaeota archaeon]|nr:MAG: CpaF family protein [Candidatus Woesearchaeota archaeon]
MGLLKLLKKSAKPVEPVETPEQKEARAKALLNEFAKEEKKAEEKAELKVEQDFDKVSSGEFKILDKYEFKSGSIPITIVIIKKKGEYVPVYEVSISSISRTTEFILEKIRQELIKKVNLGMIDIIDTKKTTIIEEKFKDAIHVLIDKYFPDVDNETKGFLNSYLISKSLGLGNIEILMSDVQLEEIVINQSSDPVWIYHRKHGWLKTNIFLRDEEQIRHYAGMIGRKVGRQVSVLEPLLDAHLEGGDRVNATLNPISTMGNTITIRKFSRDPWTITKFVNAKAISPSAAALVWLCIQYEMSAIIAGGTASGKTSTLNALANFFPPNQRVISIEDTRELQLPKYLHWVPLNTRLPNAEGRGQISMEDLLVNSLRMRPDRILVGEVRRQKEAETLFEAIHTGHSVYATFHANNAEETIQRLTNPPINVPKVMLPAISLILIQFRNRRTGMRRTFQLAEIENDATANVLMQYDPKKDVLVNRAKSKALINTLTLYTGYTPSEITREINKKVEVLKYLTKFDYKEVDQVGRIMAEYYTDYENLMKYVEKNKRFL